MKDQPDTIIIMDRARHWPSQAQPLWHGSSPKKRLAHLQFVRDRIPEWKVRWEKAKRDLLRRGVA